jgi:hypothetical protein
MRNYLIVLLLLLGSVTNSLQGQNNNSFGLRFGNFNAGISSGASSDSENSVQGGLALELVRDWATGTAGFWRGRLGLNFGIGSESVGPGTRTTLGAGAAIGIGRGHRVDLGPFAFSYGGGGALGFYPINQSRSAYISSDGTTNYEQITESNYSSVGLSGDVFLQLEWNIHRNIWIGIENRFVCSARYNRNASTYTNLTTPVAGGAGLVTETTSSTSWVSFSHPFGMPSPLFSLTFRPGGN